VEEWGARERRWPPPSYAGVRNVRVLTLHDPTLASKHFTVFTAV